MAREPLWRDDDPADSRDISDLLAGASDLRLGESRPAPSPSALGRDSPSVRSAPLCSCCSSRRDEQQSALDQSLKGFSRPGEVSI